MVKHRHLPTLYSLGVELQVSLGLDLFGYMVSIYKEYDIYHIRKDLSSSPRCLLIALRCTPTRAEHRRPYLMGWTSPGGVAHVHCRGYLGLYPPQLVPERLVSAEQCLLEQVRAV